MIEHDIQIKGARVLVLGLAFKENCPDLRNTRVVDIIENLEGLGMNVDVHDPWADAAVAQAEYSIDVVTPEPDTYDVIVLAVGHREFLELGSKGIRAFGKSEHVLYDVKGLFTRSETDRRL